MRVKRPTAVIVPTIDRGARSSMRSKTPSSPAPFSLIVTVSSGSAVPRSRSPIHTALSVAGSTRYPAPLRAMRSRPVIVPVSRGG